jgi:O-6-methylguanine DNA methyltransferase
VKPASPSRRLVSRRISTPIGTLLAAATPRGVCFLEFLGRRNPAAMRRLAPGDNRHLDRLQQELEAYFSGRLRRFRVPLDLSGTPFQRAVWKRVGQIPYGATLTYAQLAARAGRSSAVRAAGHANGRNPVSIVVPCHRVVGTDGGLHGYGGGLHRKRWLLEFEAQARG